MMIWNLWLTSVKSLSKNYQVKQVKMRGTNGICSACGKSFTVGRANIIVDGRAFSRSLVSRCVDCETGWLNGVAVVCANCGGLILPNSHVGVLKGVNGASLICHTTYECSPPGGAFYGFWGDGRLVSSFEKIEQC